MEETGEDQLLFSWEEYEYRERELNDKEEGSTEEETKRGDSSIREKEEGSDV